MIKRLNHHDLIFSPFIDYMLCYCSLMAFFFFFGFLRCGEFIIKSGNLSQDFPCIQGANVQKDKLSYILCLKYWKKTDPFRQGVLICVFYNEPTKPVDIMHEYSNYNNHMLLNQILLCVLILMFYICREINS